MLLATDCNAALTRVCAPAAWWCWQQLHRVYHGQWTDNRAKRAVIVKVVSRTQAAHEVRVLEAVGAHKESRAIQVLAQIPVNDGDVGLVTPYCPGKLFEGAASLRDVLRQAVQLCEVRGCCCAVLCCAVLSGLWCGVR